MGTETNLPFKVGELAEAKCFEEGYRGAWFHCKIRRIAKRKGKLQHLLEYYDFPDEKLSWTDLYQVPPYHEGSGREKHAELILRPAYPPVYNEKQMPLVSEISEVTVIVNNSWKVGDLVDWWKNDCHWSGKITQLLGDDEARIELNPPPFGEGSDYPASLKDVRPSLNWSLEHGWTIPTPEDDTGPPGARLIKPKNQVQEAYSAVQVEVDPVQGSAGSSAPLSYPSPVSSNSAASDAHNKSLGETVCKQLEDRNDNSPTKSRAATDLGENSAESMPKTGLKSNHALKKYSAWEEEYDNNDCLTCLCRRSDTLEAAVMELEEYVNKVKWLRNILQHGFSYCDAEGPQWEYVDLSSASEIPK